MRRVNDPEYAARYAAYWRSKNIRRREVQRQHWRNLAAKSRAAFPLVPVRWGIPLLTDFRRAV